MPAPTHDIEDLRVNSRMYDAVIEQIDGRRIRIGQDWLVDWASCNYLGFDLDPEVIEAVEPQLRRWGTHPSWSRMLGSPRLYPQLEERLTGLLGAEDVLLLPTISQIHLGAIPALIGEGTLIMESRAHRTIYDGCMFARGRGATVRRFRSGDLEELERLLRAATARPVMVCMDGVNSMTGDIPDLKRYAALCRAHDAVLYVDDAHGMGVIGERSPDEPSPYGLRGNAIVKHSGESYDNVVLVGGFSKAYSSLLAFLALPTAVKNKLKVDAPTYLYSGPSPVASLATVMAGLDVNEKRGDELRAHLYRLTVKLLSHVRGMGVHTLNVHDTPVVEIPISPDHDLIDVSERLWRAGQYVTLAPYPGVPRDEIGFRVQLTAAHTEQHVDDLNAVLTELARDGVLRPAVPRQRRPS
ncbi:aminotransferase class I/II-fold pyridoxal phosphate-dependent enzyme [Paractinoplanes brasiliensis]|uniref:8-amino-7-oxononanoate synthase n=1 Tax=Paractinoplanes brasiliensis TaxID=52695 RepID=A0A4R6JAD9_9ACTN|nr:pyridoxal phosphate-dependent aminotransferase family protein [Actinoplanes brasiliensis]TDO32640.1 8-amino-7-oxononanoate synthase [Actinoplanes brasiliensis]GID32771.1 2-amino-3-ketobutyrate CoA ligase [Actinoplanes brasiliensis]